MSKLLELKQRVETAEGPDRELDYEIWAALHGWKIRRHGNTRFFQTPDNYNSVRALRAPKLTSSLDAAIALLERMLPGWHIDLRRYSDGWYARVQERSYAVQYPVSAQFGNAALALMHALLTALQASTLANGEGE
ncbi:hypothetical protein DC522_05695 [Microvirga sp. KLBC 81]|uniref:hypothetical protein n=1 Tax=Microvirga sp. KLBC 81 TaxID=1862707 RepID=UPI000D50DEC0|nr:hypothetical protein [Microvirga sp. KLBC 81]PVE25390.1 hypothetical protein DC522_05695 [Microvirga sp. KLBC 81]